MPDRNEHGTDADQAVVAGDAPPSERVPLSRDRVVAAAVDFIDQRGLPWLTMRRLGDQLGVEAMALYRYVPGREELLDAVVEHVVGELHDDDGVVSTPTHGWQDFAQRLAHGIRRVALRHPRVFPLVVSRPPEAPWLRPPLRSLEWVEVFLEALVSEGFAEDAAVSAYRSFTSFLLGHLLLEVAAHDADVGPLDVLTPDEEPAGPGALAAYPMVRRLRSQLSTDHADVEFEDALESLLARLALVRANQPS
ncbi:TetR family transcriptional regulator [Nocardioides dongxiaopingii]|uniref:TetR/AcrR family transcriptional regulator C-terminal domain-containing protein n=1 Tax=Nocardioides sp. S-1144 TaxID=2582905 RepID=UPI00110DAE4A|nr:TetR/AcrR family transcriptional regulator C-terminal domain-containing protein [Nocardioides sp. S-1144]QCW49327.1 TetR family transcriptional regulator [Nocardioides sp. S-1144]